MSNRDTCRDDDADAHLDEVDAGAGCAEIWEHLSGRRSRQSAEDD